MGLFGTAATPATAFAEESDTKDFRRSCFLRNNRGVVRTVKARSRRQKGGSSSSVSTHLEEHLRRSPTKQTLIITCFYRCFKVISNSSCAWLGTPTNGEDSRMRASRKLIKTRRNARALFVRYI
jgi:hypothetical protein